MIAGIVNTQAHQKHQKGKHYARELCVFTYYMRAIEDRVGRENAERTGYLRKRRGSDIASA